jgi:hypothetical protein
MSGNRDPIAGGRGKAPLNTTDALDADGDAQLGI